MQISDITAENTANIRKVLFLYFLCTIRKFSILKLFDLKRRKIYKIFDAEDEGMLFAFRGRQIKKIKI